MPTTNKRARISTLLGNTRTMAVIAFLLAIVIWLAVSINESPVVERVVRDVKVEVDESMPAQLGYEAFGADNLYVDVTVSGKRYEYAVEIVDEIALDSEKPSGSLIEFVSFQGLLNKYAAAGYRVVGFTDREVGNHNKLMMSGFTGTQKQTVIIFEREVKN